VRGTARTAACRQGAGGSGRAAAEIGNVKQVENFLRELEQFFKSAESPTGDRKRQEPCQPSPRIAHHVET
jgi:hypothetical protein